MSCQTRLLGTILKLQIAFVDIQPGTYLVACKEDVLQSVVIEIPHTHSPAHIRVLVDEHIYRIVLRNGILKIDAGLRRRQKGEMQSLTRFGGRAGNYA